MTKRLPKAAAVPVCTPKVVIGEAAIVAARRAIEIYPANAPSTEGPGDHPPARLALLTSKYWGPAGKQLTVSFIDNPAKALRDRILGHMNAWSEFCGMSFVWSQSGGVIRVTREYAGYWSYLGVDALGVARDEPTFCLQGFTMQTKESEFTRVVRHEAGHAVGFHHEQLRRKIVDRLDVRKTLDYFARTQGWDEASTRFNVLTPIEDAALTASDLTDETSIMCYQLPASITKDGRPIPGGADFSATDRTHAAKVYPKGDAPAPPQPPPVSKPVAFQLKQEGTRLYVHAPGFAVLENDKPLT